MEHAFGGPTRPGDWLEFDSERRCVYLKGEAPEPVVGREEQPSRVILPIPKLNVRAVSLSEKRLSERPARTPLRPSETPVRSDF